MRPADDLALRVQNWFWYWQVRVISGLSDDQLDVKAFGDVGRKRHFERIRQSASSPDEFPLFEGQTLMAVVDRWDALSGSPGPFSSATTAYRSQLWHYLTTRDLPQADYTDFIQAYVCDRGWYRAQARDLSLCAMFLGESEPAIGPVASSAYSAMLHKLAEAATPDSLAVLIALFREAVHAVLLHEAMAIKVAINVTLARIEHTYAMPDHVIRLLWRLVHDRVLSNVWVTEADWRQHSALQRGIAKSSRTRIKELRNWVDWYLNGSQAHSSARYGLFPIVPRSPRIDWLERNRESLEVAYTRVIQQRQRPESARCAWPEELQREIPETLLVPDAIAQALGRPTGEPLRFYSAPPSIEIGFLPKAY